jgi:HEAT repeat protein
MLAVMVAGTAPSCANRAKRRAARKEQAPPVRQPEAARYDPVEASALRERAIETLNMLAADPQPEWRLNALEALTDAPGRLVPAVERGLRDSNEGVRAGAAMIAGRTGIPGLVGALRPLLNDRSPYVQAAAIYALTKVGAPPDPTPLGTMLLNDPSIRVRSHVVVILGDLGDPSALPMIRHALTRSAKASPVEQRLFQIQAAEAMYKLGEEAQIETILAALLPATADDLEVTALAVQILGELEYRPAIADLNNLAGDVDPSGRRMPAEVRLAAAAALAKLGQPRGVALIADEFATDQNPALRAQAAYVYGAIGNAQDLARLKPMMGDQSGLVRVYASSAILKVSGRLAAVNP